jgi:predicted phage baseplate assembly protein
MPLPTVELDDRRFQDIVDQAKTLIPQYCPEWTDHNVSDPGVTLIELFAWMTDLVLYRVNQTPDKMYLKFLEMIGVRLDPPRAARAPVTFYFSAAHTSEVTVPENTEVATIRTESTEAIVFSTETDLVVRPPVLIGAFTRDVDRVSEDQWKEHDLELIDFPGHAIEIFSPDPNAGDAFYLAFEKDISNHILALTMDCEHAGGTGVDPDNPPVQWEVWQGGAIRWAPCERERDTTKGFNQAGEIVLHVPQMAQGAFRDVSAYWLRCRMTKAAPGAATYTRSPEISQLKLESRGGTVFARHALTILNEEVGSSTGVPGQIFRLRHTPILAREEKRDYLEVITPEGEEQRWIEVADFADSGPQNRHFALDGVDGTLTLGPALLQPDGTVYSFGAVPPKGSRLRFTRYQSGGGITGNVPRGMLNVMKSSIPYVASVLNRQPAVGGRNAQNVEDAKLRAPQALRTRTRAVTADDFQTLARQVPGVERAHCLTPLAQPGAPGAPRPGEIVVLVLPQADDTEGYIIPERLSLSAELKQAVEAYLNQRRLLGTRLQVIQPDYFWISIEAKVRLPDSSGDAFLSQVRRRAEDALFRYLNPYVGGPDGTGWPFGRDLHVSELYALLQRVPGVEFVDELRIFVRDAATGAAPQPAPPRLTLPPGGLICSDAHRVNRR